MNFSFWNVRGLNRTPKQHLVKKFILQYHISFIALIETKIKDSILPAITKKIAKDWSWISNVGLAGKARVLILWDSNILEIQALTFSDQHITVTLKSLGGRINCVLSSVYGFNHAVAGKELWSDLSHISHSIGNIPWLISGDFNAMISSDEKLGGGGALLSDSDTEDFKKFIELNKLTHLKTDGCFFTWNNKQEASNRVWSRLDRGQINDAWLHQFTSSHIEYLLPSFSDHSPGLISVFEECDQGKKPFRFFKMWTKHVNYIPTVSSIWQKQVSGYTMFAIS